MNSPQLTLPRRGDALVMVDLQRDYLPGGVLEVPHGDQVIEALNRHATQFDKLGLPVFVARDWHPVNHASFQELGGHWPPHCMAGTHGAELPQSLHLPASAQVLSKGVQPESDGRSAFDNTHLAALLRRHGARRVFIGGLSTDDCVSTTALDALREGFEVVLLVDAIRTVDTRPGDTARAMAQLRKRGAQLAHLDQAA